MIFKSSFASKYMRMHDIEIDSVIIRLVKRLMDIDREKKAAEDNKDSEKALSLIKESLGNIERINYLCRIKQIRLIYSYWGQDAFLKSRISELDSKYSLYSKELKKKLKKLKSGKNSNTEHMKQFHEHHEKAAHDYRQFREKLERLRQDIGLIRKSIKKNCKNHEWQKMLYRHA